MFIIFNNSFLLFQTLQSFKRVNSKAANKKGDRQKALLSKDKNSANNAQNKLDHETSDGIVAKHNINKRKSKKAERKDDYFCDAPSMTNFAF